MRSKVVTLLFSSFVLVACGDDDATVDAGADAGPAPDTAVGDSGGSDATSDVAIADVGIDAGGVDSGSDGGVGDVPAVEGAPNVAGPYSVSTQTGMVGSTPISACIPDGVRAPLIVFAPGFMIESRFYEPTCQRLASHGFVVVRADPPSGFTTSHDAMRASLIGVLDWVLSESPFVAQIDPGNILMSGHSLGGKLATMVAAQDARVTAVFAIDPVDGGFGAPDIVPSQAMGLTIPVGFAGETTNASGGFMPCAPAAENFQQFYAATTSAPWAAEWDFTGADHMDFVSAPGGCPFCGLCPEGSADPATVVEGLHTIFVAFARRHLRADVNMDEWLLGGLLPAGIVVMSR